MTTTDAEAIARIIEERPFEEDYPKGSAGAFNARGRKEASIKKANRILSYLASRREAQEPVAPFVENGYGSRLLREAVAYLNEYVFDFDSGADHEPTEFERFMMEDMLNGLFSHEPFFGIIRNLAATPAPADDLVARLKRLEIEAANLNYKLVPEPVPERGPDAPVPAPAGEVERLVKPIIDRLEWNGRLQQWVVRPDLPAGTIKAVRAALNGGRSDA